VQRKAAVVASDERESGPRALLNFGHTVGHALEGLAARRGAARRLRHGEAVALGMIAAARVSRAAGTCGPDVESRITALLARLGLPIDLDGQPELPEALEHLGRDKKAVTGPDGATGINFVCVERVGRALLARLTPAAVGSAVLRTGARRNP
jgi:3-dehydroquinate synthetase